MYNIYCNGHFYERHISYKAVKLKEAYCRGLRLDYEITYPDGTILQTKFIAK